MKGLLHFYIVKAVPMNRNSLGAMGVAAGAQNGCIFHPLRGGKMPLFYLPPSVLRAEWTNLLLCYKWSHSIRAARWYYSIRCEKKTPARQECFYSIQVRLASHLCFFFTCLVAFVMLSSSCSSSACSPLVGIVLVGFASSSSA